MEAIDVWPVTEELSWLIYLSYIEEWAVKSRSGVVWREVAPLERVNVE